ncbi:sulfate permease, SulP family [Ruaniaceae bacterium KH17]|nr:sulfate permease, SulP family [Ruaniaceae bacterium KH17]
MSTWEHVRGLLPRRDDYRAVRNTWRHDLLAGLTVGIVALPLALGFGISSGAGAEAGIITAIVAGFVAAIFGGSSVQVSGPTGAMVVVLAPIVATHGVGAVAVVSLLAGAILCVTGVMRMGRAVTLIPWPVIEGFTLGIAVIIFLQQIPALIAPSQRLSTNAVIAAFQAIGSADLGYAIWALGCVAIVATCMIGLPKIHARIPASLVGIVLATVFTSLVPNPLEVIGELPNSLPAPALPQMDLALIQQLALPALAVAALAGIESLLSVRVAASMADTGRYEPDRELLGQGLASIASGLSGGMPATGAIARTAVNLRAGARTRLAAAFHAVVLLAIILFVAAPVGAVPLAALAGVLMMTAIRMVDRTTSRAILRSTRSGAAAFVITAVITVSVDLIFAVIIGVAVTGFFALRALAQATGVRREPIAGAEPGDEKIAFMRFTGPLFFAASDRVAESVAEHGDAEVVILAMSQLEVVDATGARALSEIIASLQRRGAVVLVKGVLPRHADLFERVGVWEALENDTHMFSEMGPALVHARFHIERGRCTRENSVT